MKNKTTWKCPSCGGSNNKEILRCTCGYEISLADSGEEDVNYFKYEPTLTDDSSAFDYKSGKEIKDFFIITVFTFICIFVAVGLFSALFGSILSEVGLALEGIIFSVAAVALNQKYPLNFRIDDFLKVAKYGLAGAVFCLIRYWPYFTHLAEDKAAPEKYMAFVGLPIFRSYIYLSLAVIVLPFLEEVLFRGFLFRLLIKKYDMFTAVVTSSFLFSAVHGFDKGWFMNYFLFALVTCYVYNKSQSIWASIIMHSANNAIWFWGTGLFLK
jgi:membrane protease YdiL (CAAX protease family)